VKRLLVVLLACVLASCGPLLQQGVQLAQGGLEAVQNDPGTLTRDGVSILLNNPGPEAMIGNPNLAGDGVAVDIQGSDDLVIAAPPAWRCSLAKPGRWHCDVPNIAAGTRARFSPGLNPVTKTVGTITDAYAAFYRPATGARPIILGLVGAP